MNKTESTNLSELERLVALKVEGHLSEEEFEQAKAIVLEQDKNATRDDIEEIVPDKTPEAVEVELTPIQEDKNKISANEVIGYTNKYGTALTVGSLISGIGWLVIIGCILGAVISATSRSFEGPLMAGVFLGSSIMGLVAVASGQLIRAAVDVANNSAALLALEKAKWDRNNG